MKRIIAATLLALTLVGGVAQVASAYPVRCLSCGGR